MGRGMGPPDGAPPVAGAQKEVQVPELAQHCVSIGATAGRGGGGRWLCGTGNEGGRGRGRGQGGGGGGVWHRHKDRGKGGGGVKAAYAGIKITVALQDGTAPKAGSHKECHQ